MVIKGVKHLAPMADMDNYRASGDQRKSGERGRTFLELHVVDLAGNLLVKADRDVKGPALHMFEDVRRQGQQPLPVRRTDSSRTTI